MEAPGERIAHVDDGMSQRRSHRLRAFTFERRCFERAGWDGHLRARARPQRDRRIDGVTACGIELGEHVLDAINRRPAAGATPTLTRRKAHRSGTLPESTQRRDGRPPLRPIGCARRRVECRDRRARGCTARRRIRHALREALQGRTRAVHGARILIKQTFRPCADRGRSRLPGSHSSQDPMLRRAGRRPRSRRCEACRRTGTRDCQGL